jgi:hypothetical protein
MLSHRNTNTTLTDTKQDNNQPIIQRSPRKQPRSYDGPEKQICRRIMKIFTMILT